MEREPHLAGGSTNKESLWISRGKRDRSPFPAKLIERTRDRLRSVLPEGGFGSGLPLECDVPPPEKGQHFEVRLMQALALAFGDPDVVFFVF